MSSRASRRPRPLRCVRLRDGARGWLMPRAEGDYHGFLELGRFVPDDRTLRAESLWRDEVEFETPTPLPKRRA